jgi:hypothetical protein
MTAIGEIGRQGSFATGVADPELLDSVVVQLREIERRSGLQRTLAIGGLVLESFFAGDPRIWRDRRRNKNHSIRRLASRQDCPFCRSALNDAVGVFVAVSRMPCVRTFGHITSSHVAAVLKLQEPDREKALQRAEDGRWSVRQLRDHVTRERHSH